MPTFSVKVVHSKWHVFDIEAKSADEALEFVRSKVASGKDEDLEKLNEFYVDDGSDKDFVYFVAQAPPEEDICEIHASNN